MTDGVEATRERNRLTLDEIRAELPPSHWQHSKEFERVNVAFEFGVTPSAFLQLPTEDQAYLIARQRVMGLIDSYENHLQAKEAKRQRGKK